MINFPQHLPLHFIMFRVQSIDVRSLLMPINNLDFHLWHWGLADDFLQLLYIRVNPKIGVQYSF